MARVLGIDATKTTVRTALVRTSYRKVTLEALGEASVAVAGSEVEALRQALGTLRPDACAVALSGEKSFYRQLDLPGAAQKEIDAVLGFELESTVPFEMTDAVYDFRLLRTLPGVEGVPIFAALARIDDVQNRIAVVREAIGQEPERVGTGALPLCDLCSVVPELERPAPKGERPTPVGILDLGDTSSDVVVLEAGEPVFARTLSRGTEGLPHSAPALARELRQTLAAWRTLGGLPLSELYLVGGGASAQGAELYLSTELGVAIVPLPTPRLEGLSPEQAASLPRFAKALGLALGLVGKPRSLNLRRGNLQAQRSYPFLRERIPLLAGLGSVVAVSFVFSIVAELRGLEAERGALVAELGATTQAVFGEEAADVARAKELLEASAADEDPMPRADAFDVMVQLSKAVPKDIAHDVLELDFARQHATIQGVVPTNKDAEQIAEKLKEHRCFKDVKIPRTSPFGGAEAKKQKYVLEFDVKCSQEKKKKTEPEGSASPASGSAKPEDKR